MFKLQKQISIDGIWKVVSYPEQAHFIIEYRVDTVGKDKAYVVIKRRDGKILYTSKKYGSGESASDNYAAAKKIYNTELYPSVTARGKNKVLF